MKRLQRTLTATVAAAALLGSFAVNVYAQPQNHQGNHGNISSLIHAPRAHQQDFAGKHADRMEQLKTVLQLQPNQQAAFDQYVKAVTPTPRDPAAQTERQDLRTLTTPERLDLAQKLRKERMAQVEQREQATRTFYNSLSASQQKAFDTLSTRDRGNHGKHDGHNGKKNGKHGQSKSGNHQGSGMHSMHPAAAAS